MKSAFLETAPSFLPCEFMIISIFKSIWKKGTDDTGEGGTMKVRKDQKHLSVSNVHADRIVAVAQSSVWFRFCLSGKRQR